MKYIALIVSMLILCTVVFAFPVEMPNEIEVHDSNEFFIEITNPTSETKSLSIDFFSPTESRISAPKNIPPHSKTSAKVSLNYSPPNYTEVVSKLEIYLGNELEERQITLIVYPDPASQTGSFALGGDFLVGLIGLNIFGEMLSFTVLEWALFIVLIIVAAILVISFIARFVKRRERKKRNEWKK